MGKILIYVWRTAVQRGLLGGDRTWMTVFAVFGAAKLMRRIAGSVPETVYREELAPGQALIITHLTETFESAK